MVMGSEDLIDKIGASSFLDGRPIQVIVVRDSKCVLNREMSSLMCTPKNLWKPKEVANLISVVTVSVTVIVCTAIIGGCWGR